MFPQNYPPEHRLQGATRIERAWVHVCWSSTYLVWVPFIGLPVHYGALPNERLYPSRITTAVQPTFTRGPGAMD